VTFRLVAECLKHCATACPSILLLLLLVSSSSSSSSSSTPYQPLQYEELGIADITAIGSSISQYPAFPIHPCRRYPLQILLRLVPQSPSIRHFLSILVEVILILTLSSSVSTFKNSPRKCIQIFIVRRLSFIFQLYFIYVIRVTVTTIIIKFN
jgi:hypothetical protein